MARLQAVHACFAGKKKKSGCFAKSVAICGDRGCDPVMCLFHFLKPIGSMDDLAIAYVDITIPMNVG